MSTRRITFDHAVIHVTDWERSNVFYRDVLEAELVRVGNGWAYRLGEQQINVHGPGVEPAPVARIPVPPGGSDLCLRWHGPIGAAVDHLDQHGVQIELGPIARRGALGAGTSVYFRDPDGTLLELISYD